MLSKDVPLKRHVLWRCVCFLQLFSRIIRALHVKSAITELVTRLVICITCVSVFRVDTNNIDRILLHLNASKIEIEQNFHRILQDLASQNDFWGPAWSTQLWIGSQLWPLTRHSDVTTRWHVTWGWLLTCRSSQEKDSEWFGEGLLLLLSKEKVGNCPRILKNACNFALSWSIVKKIYMICNCHTIIRLICEACPLHLLIVHIEVNIFPSTRFKFQWEPFAFETFENRALSHESSGARWHL